MNRYDQIWDDLVSKISPVPPPIAPGELVIKDICAAIERKISSLKETIEEARNRGPEWRDSAINQSLRMVALQSCLNAIKAEGCTQVDGTQHNTEADAQMYAMRKIAPLLATACFNEKILKFRDKPEHRDRAEQVVFGMLEATECVGRKYVSKNKEYLCKALNIALFVNAARTHMPQSLRFEIFDFGTRLTVVEA